MKLLSALIAVAVADETTPDPCSFQASTLTCEPNALKLEVPFCAYAAAFVEVGDVHIGGADAANQIAACAGTVVDAAGVAEGEVGFTTGEKVVYDITGDQCGITNPNTETHIVYSGELFAKIGESDGVISREKIIDMDLQCEFSRSLDVSVDQVFTPIVSSVQITMDTVSSAFGVDMQLFTDATHNTALDANHQVNVPDPIYAKVALDVTDNLVAQVKKCYATPTADGEGDISYTFIDNYEAVETTDMELTNNCDGTSSSFWINSFAFVNADQATQTDVYLHCELHVCDPDTEDCTCPPAEAGTGGGAPPAPTSRRRRSYEPVAKPNATLRVGPISVSNLQQNF